MKNSSISARSQDLFRAPLLRRGFICALAGALSSLGFAPFGIFPAPVVGLAVLFHVWLDDRTPRNALVHGWLFGLGLFVSGVLWLRISIDQFGNVGTAFAVGVTLVFIAAMAIYPAAAGWLLKRFGDGRPATDLLLAYPAVWTLAEWLRGWFLTGFPWLSIGYAQIDTPLSGLGPLLGVYGLSWAAAFSAGAMVCAFRCRGMKRITVGMTAVLIWLLSFGLSSFEWTEPSGSPIRVSLLQGNVPQHIKWLPEVRRPTMDLYYSLTDASWDSDLIVWPETAVPAYADRVEEEFLKPLQREARRQGVDIILGIATFDASTGRYYNSLLGLGRQRSVYHKRHLVPFGEFLPLKPLIGPLLSWMAIPMSDFSAGSAEKPLLHGAGYPIGVSICYEDAFGAEVIEALPEAAFLINASNDAWFGDSLAPHQHMEMARMRALEARRYLLRSTNTGVSAIIDPMGKVQAKSPQFQTHVLSAEIVPRTGFTPFARWGNAAVVLLLFGAWALSAFMRRFGASRGSAAIG